MPRFTINTPFPGTPFYEQMKKENRIIENDWSKYDLHHVVIKPKNMSKAFWFFNKRTGMTRGRNMANWASDL